jgi:hypothetical protein
MPTDCCACLTRIYLKDDRALVECSTLQFEQCFGHRPNGAYMHKKTCKERLKVFLKLGVRYTKVIMH